MFVNDITALDSAVPVFLLGAATDLRVTGGTLAQANAKPLATDGIARLACPCFP